MIKIEIKDSVKIIENRNKIHYFVSGIEIFNFYFNFIEFFLSCYPKSIILRHLHHLYIYIKIEELDMLVIARMTLICYKIIIRPIYFFCQGHIVCFSWPWVYIYILILYLFQGL